jgi:putative ABC transport system substrate-binding protein
MRRRQFIALLGGAAAWPLATRAQQAPIPVVGYFSDRSYDSEAQMMGAFRQGLEETGYVEGHNVRIEYRFSNGHDNRLPAIAIDLLRQPVNVLVAMDGSSALAAKEATTAIPIVFSAGGDPVKLGLVERLNRPEGNSTGVFVFVTELGPKRLQLIREVVPHTTLIAYIVNLSSGSGLSQAQAMQAAAEAMGAANLGFESEH